MRYAILGGDLRFAHLAKMLNESGRHAAGFLQEKAGGERHSLDELKKYDCIISNWPMKWPLSDVETEEREILSHIAPGSVLLLCGPKFPQNRRWDLQYINLWQDETLLRENAWLTAEAAVAAVMHNDVCEIRETECLVMGYGRIGRALVEVLINLGAKVTVVSGSEEKRCRAESRGAQVFPVQDIAGALPGKRIIFSTAPAQVLDKDVLAHVSKEACIIDLASPPYGVDLDAARDMKLNARLEPGLPGRYCPMSAARTLHNAIIRWEEAELNET